MKTRRNSPIVSTPSNPFAMASFCEPARLKNGTPVHSSGPIFRSCGGRAEKIAALHRRRSRAGPRFETVQRHVFRSVVEEGSIRAGVELEANGPHSVGEPGRDDERTGQLGAIRRRSRATSGI